MVTVRVLVSTGLQLGFIAVLEAMTPRLGWIFATRFGTVPNPEPYLDY